MARSTFGGSTTGFAELEAALQALVPKAAVSAGRSAARAGAKVIQKSIREAAPVSDIEEGAKRGKAGPHAKISKHIAIKKGRSSVSGGIVYLVGTGHAFQSIFVERGTIHQAAKPFAVAAFERAAPAAIEAIGVALRKQIEKKGGTVEL